MKEEFMMLKNVFRAVAFSFVVLTAPSVHAQEAFSEGQKQALQGMMKDYLLKNPEIIQDALIELDRRQQAAQESAQKAALKEGKQSIFESAGAVIVGNPKGDVTLVEFFDYNCGFCKKSLGDVQELIKADPKLRVILKDFPVLGPDSVEASRVALAAKKQLKQEQMLEFHAKIMNIKGRVTGERALQLAKEMGLNAEKIQTDMNSPEIKALIEENVKLGDKLSLTGTPAFIIGEEIVFGAVGVEPLRKSIANLRKCGKAEC
jgi:protein-disulfide isomerase